MHKDNAARKVDPSEIRFVQPRKLAAPPKSMTVQVQTLAERAIERNARDLSQAVKLTDREVVQRIEAKKQQEKQARKAERTREAPPASGVQPAASKPAKEGPAFFYRLQLADGRFREDPETDSDVMKLREPLHKVLPALKDQLLESDRYSNIRIAKGVFLVIWKRNDRGERAEIRLYADREAATLAGERALDEGAERFTVDTILHRTTVLRAEQAPSRDPHLTRGGPVMSKSKNYNRFEGWQRVSNSRCSFSHG